MIKICNENLEKLLKLATPWPEGLEIGDHYESGYLTSKFLIPEREILQVSKYIEILGVKKLYLAWFSNYGDPGINTALILKKDAKLVFFYDVVYGTSDISRILMINRFPKDDYFILEQEEEIELFKKANDWKQLKIRLKSITDFLKNPWEDYEAKKRRYEEKLVKVKSSTENKIKVYEETKEEIEKKMKTLENDLLGSFQVEKK